MLGFYISLPEDTETARSLPDTYKDKVRCLLWDRAQAGLGAGRQAALVSSASLPSCLWVYCGLYQKGPKR